MWFVFNGIILVRVWHVVGARYSAFGFLLRARVP